MVIRTETSRPYRQVARAAATEATRARIVEAFRKSLREGWYEDVTLDKVAAASGTTRQTVIRLFGGKEELLAESCARLSVEIRGRRGQARAASIPGIVDALIDDYEAIGDFVIRMLAQELRHPNLSAFLNRGRAGHRAWVEESFEPWLAALPPPTREERTVGLVLATDVYSWKLLRRDLKRSRKEAAAIVRDLILGLIGPIDNKTKNGR